MTEVKKAPVETSSLPSATVRGASSDTEPCAPVGAAPVPMVTEPLAAVPTAPVKRLTAPETLLPTLPDDSTSPPLGLEPLFMWPLLSDTLPEPAFPGTETAPELIVSPLEEVVETSEVDREASDAAAPKVTAEAKGPPQHTSASLAFRPHAPCQPQASVVNVPSWAAAGTAVSPEALEPQHTTVPANKAQVKRAPAHMSNRAEPAVKTAAGMVVWPAEDDPQQAGGTPTAPHAQQWEPPQAVRTPCPAPAAYS